jgi:hypothetical protein
MADHNYMTIGNELAYPGLDLEFICGQNLQDKQFKNFIYDYDWGEGGL